MKKIEKIAVLGIILYLASWIIRTFGTYFGSAMTNKYGWSRGTAALLSLPFGIVLIIFNIVIAFWLFIIAKRHNMTPWVWILFSLVGGLLAPILFYAIKIYQILNQLKEAKGPLNRGDA